MDKIYGWWISPDGIVYPIYNELGHRIFMETYFHKNFESDEDVYKSTIDEGWIRVVNKNEFIVNYKFISTRKQLHILENFEKEVMYDNNINPSLFYLEYNNTYHTLSSWSELVSRIKDRM